MKVLLVDVDNPFGPAPGGQATYSKEFVYPLADVGEVTVLTLGSVSALPQSEIKYISIKKISSNPKVSFLYFSWCARRFVRKYGSDYSLILEQFTSPIGPLGLPGLTTTPVIGIAAFSFWKEMAEKYHLPFDRIANRALRKYNRVVVLHNGTAAKIQEINPAAGILVTPLTSKTIDTAPSSTVANMAVFIGRLDVHQKGIDLLLRALEMTTVENLQVRCVGFSESDPKWAHLRKGRHFKADLRAVGYLQREEFSQVLGSARVLLAPSRYEGPSYVPLIGAAHEVPTVAFNLSCFSDWSDFMFLAEPLSPESFAREIDRAFYDSEAYSYAKIACRVQTFEKSQDSRAAFVNFVVSSMESK